MTLKACIRQFCGNETVRKVTPFVCAGISAAGFARSFNYGTTNIMTLILAILMVPVFRAAMQPKTKQIRIGSIVCGFFFALATFMMKYEWLTQQEEHAALYAFEMTLGFLLFFPALCAVLYERLCKLRLNTPGEEPPRKKRLAVFFGSAAIMFFGWLPYFLMLFPGDLTWDSIDELNQSVGNFELSNHHPVVHTAVIKLFYSIGKAVFGDDNRAVATYCIAQMLLLAFSFAYLIVTMYRMRVKKLPIIAVLACYTIFSYNGTYSTTIWKDIPFAMLVLCFSVTLWRWLMLHQMDEQRKTPVFETVMLFFTGLGMCLFRSNGLYAYMLTFVFLLIFCIRFRQKVLLAVCAAVLVLAVIAKGPVYKALGIKPPETMESLAMPQQMVGAVLKNERYITPEQRELIQNVADIEGIKEHYYASSADGIKYYVWYNGNENYIAEHRGEFFKLWLDLGLKYPKDYIIAYVNQTYGYWHPDVQNWVYASEFRSDNFELSKDPKLSEKNCENLRDFRELYHRYYFLGLFWSIGAAVWAAVFMMGCAFSKQKLRMVLLYFPVAGVWATLMLAAPVFAEFRYAYSIFVTVPLLCAIPFVSHEGLVFKGSAAKATVPAADAKPDEDAKPEAEPTEPEVLPEQTAAGQPEQTPEAGEQPAANKPAASRKKKKRK